MKAELEDKLVRKYPKIFAQKDLPPSQSLMCFGFECGDGWYNIIDNLCGCIQSYVDANTRTQVEAVQVKEKYGTLSFYISSGDDTVYGMIWLAEYMSGRICEQCGKEGKLRGTDWLFTMCDDCWAKHQKGRQ